MKTPEEIKRGLEYIAETNVTRKVDLIRAGIAYQFTEDLAADVIAYIQQLEDHIRDLTKKVPKWISVEERLPENDGKYLCYISNQYHRGCTILNFSQNLQEVDDYDFVGQARPGWYWLDNECGYIESSNVTHWMSLPEPPKE